MATTVTQADLRSRGFRVPLSYWVPARFALGLTKPKRRVLGTEMMGVVEEVGVMVDRFQLGDEVFALTGHGGGCYAEFLTIPQNGVIAKKPKNLSYEEAAALPMGALTALHFLREGGVGVGQRVLIYGASGSIGTFAVQLAKDMGAKVTGVCSTGNIDLVRSLGAEDVIDYSKEDLVKDADAMDVVFDTVGKPSSSRHEASEERRRSSPGSRHSWNEITFALRCEK
ncbi:MAG: NAD(P)-dependent alcohol dehydrogenase [Desulfobacterales bacterium]|nr:NAD(P)-dependent alcohol dehydrogenase [Desulfobacterales bacterium]